MNMVTQNLLPFAAVQAKKMRHKKKAAAYKRPENQIFYYDYNEDIEDKKRELAAK